MIQKYRKKPVVIEAIQYDGYNQNEIAAFMMQVIKLYHSDDGKEYLEIPTLEGDMRADIGDYIIKGVNDEFYPCKPDIFEKTYDKVD